MSVHIIRLIDTKYRLKSNSLDINQLRETVNLLAIFTIFVSTTEKEEDNYIV